MSEPTHRPDQGAGASGSATGTVDPASAPVLKLTGVSKSFDGTTVLKRLDLEVHRGETLILLGENGAGKSTLKNILCGLIQSDGGDIEFDGVLEEHWSSQRAKDLGLAAIHQELSLFSNLTVAENVNMLNLGRGRTGFVSMKQLVTRTDDMFRDLLEIELDSSQLVSDLPLGQRQLVEIVKAIQSASSVLVLDEPTTSLSISERQQLFQVMRRLRADGYALIHVTHFLEEVEEVGDNVAVMRDGEIVAFKHKGELSIPQIEQLMVGRELAALHHDKSSMAPDAPVVLDVSDIRDEVAKVNGVSLSVRKGEILGIAGLTGAGRSELMQALIGLRPSDGTVVVDGEPFGNRSVLRSRRRGMVLVSEDRRSEQAFLERTVRENMTSARLDRVSNRLGLMRNRKERALTTALIDEFGVKTGSSEALFGAMSGGNQQKGVLARWLSLAPRVCLLDEPTKGIDVGAKAEVQRTIFELADDGVAVVVVSSDLPELFQVSDRILVMRGGKIAAELARDEFDPATILRATSSGRN